MKKLALFMSLGLLGACSLIPDELRLKGDENLIGYESINRLEKSPQQFGSPARWAGQISRVYNTGDSTEVEIIVLPQTLNSKPLVNNTSPGRFKAIIDEVIDPIHLREGALITVLGRVGDNEEGLIGENNYRYPTLETESYYVWVSKKISGAGGLRPVGLRPSSNISRPERSLN